MLRETGCAGIMVGRGAVQDPLLFRRVKHAFDTDGDTLFLSREEEVREIKAFLNAFAAEAFVDDTGHGRESSSSRGGGTTSTNGSSISSSGSSRTTSPNASPTTGSNNGNTRGRKPKTSGELENYKLGKLKQICKYLFAGNPELREHVAEVLNASAKRSAKDSEESDLSTATELLERINELVEKHWRAPEDVLVDAFSMRGGYENGMKAAR
jgi:tRNA-dihydrouridine synthase C